MTIKIYPDRIEFIDGANTYTMSEGSAPVIEGTSSPSQAPVSSFLNFTGAINAASFDLYNPIQGDNAGFFSGGLSALPAPVSYRATMDKFPFATLSNAAFFGNLSVARGGNAGHSSGTNGFTSGGTTRQPPPTTLTLIFSNVIDKFPFATNVNASDVGDLTSARRNVASQQSTTEGYASGGAISPPPNIIVLLNNIEKFPFATNANATDVGDLSVTRGAAAGQSSTTHGYSSGGYTPAVVNTIDRFSFASGGNATDVGDLSMARGYAAGQSSSTHGYTSGGWLPGIANVIDRFPFATNTNATDVGDLTVTRYWLGGSSSSTHGYSAGGGATPTAVKSNVIDRFPFASGGNATDVGDLSTVAREGPAGQQD